MHDPLRWRAAFRPAHPAILFDGRTVTYAELDTRTNQLANALVTLGVVPGDRVALLGQNSVEFLEATYAISKAGAISVPLGYRSVPRELRSIIEHSGARAAIVDAEYRTLLAEAAAGTDIAESRTLVIGGNYEQALLSGSTADPGIRVDDSEPYAFLYTSGTTGAPKGVVQTHRGRATHQTIAAAEFDVRPEDIVSAAAPLYNSGPIFWALMTLSAGATVGLVKRFDAARFDADLVGQNVTYLPLMPTLFNRWIDAVEAEGRWGETLPKIRMLLTAGEPMLANTRERLFARFPQAGMVEHYGSTELGVVVYLRPEDFAVKSGSVGRPMFGQNVSLRDDDGKEVGPGEVGELWAGGVGQMQGYYKLPDVTAEVMHGDLMESGDLAQRDDDGFYYIVGRKKDTIKTGGATVYPAEVESVLIGHEAVREVAVVGLPDERWGELVVAAVVLEPGANPDTSAILKFANDDLATYKRPRAVYFVDEFPKSPAGKVLKRELKQQLIERGPA